MYQLSITVWELTPNIVKEHLHNLLFFVTLLVEWTIGSSAPLAWAPSGSDIQSAPHLGSWFHRQHEDNEASLSLPSLSTTQAYLSTALFGNGGLKAALQENKSQT